DPAAANNPRISAMFKKVGVELYTAVVAETVGSESFTAEAIAASVKNTLREKSHPVFHGEKEAFVAGIRGIRLESEAQLQGHSMRFTHWVAPAGGECFQLMSWGSVSREEITAANLQFAASFHVLDPKRSVTPAAQRLTTYRSSTYGWSIDC